MKLISILIVFVFTLSSAVGQSLITPFASATKSDEYMISNSGGEVFIGTICKDYKLVQGFQQPIKMSSDLEIYIPNVISRYSEDINGSFVIGITKNKTLEVLQLTVLNNKGVVMYQKQDFELSSFDDWWDGTSNGKMVDTGVYTYVLEYNEAGQSQSKTGSLTVL